MQQYKPLSQASERKLNSPLNCIHLLQPKLTRCNFQRLLCQQQTLWNKVLWKTKLYFSSTTKPCNQHSYPDSCIIFMWVWSQWINKVLFLWYLNGFPLSSFAQSRSCKPKAEKEHSNTLEAFWFLKVSNQMTTPLLQWGEKNSHQLVKVLSFSS